ncbi:hypothetical protein FHT77_005852 [Rhizobium sp. BK181]|uniref:hypothetical protein n=1 Tax=Rhizobium sp. BK181 TaxID=2587072 RepID=UPI00161BD773|nr:hypothetical protein [Rhizobium sp. BK181]MBB3319934.1 hypothetical protein [Rhizobium sp. BK181]
MNTIPYEYIGQRFKPREGTDQQLLLFVAPAEDIRSWAGVPRKAFDYQHGFQRTLNPGRVGDVMKYFKDSERNISPTSVVVGLTGAVEITPLKDVAGNFSEIVKITINAPDYAAMPIEELIDAAVVAVRTRLNETAVTQIEENLNRAFADAVTTEDVDQSFGIVSDKIIEDGGGIAAEGDGRSYLADFYAQLRGYQERLDDLPAENTLRETLYSILKPAVLVDGQHRVFGGASSDESMLFSVCAIPGSTWAESVFQFVIINQKAKPIKPAFLSSIIATSLSTKEIDEVYTRLRSSSIDVERSEVMERLNTEPSSPFKGMIDFEVEGAPGYLQFPGMAKLARDFQNIPNTHSVLLRSGSWDDVAGDWIDHFFAFWRGIREYFEGQDNRLWSEPSSDRPNNLLKIVSLQVMQQVVLDGWADSRIFRLDDVDGTCVATHSFWMDFPSTFFTDEWRQKGLQTSVGRGILSDAIRETRRNIGRKNWGHRRLKLFSD